MLLCSQKNLVSVIIITRCLTKRPVVWEWRQPLQAPLALGACVLFKPHRSGHQSHGPEWNREGAGCSWVTPASTQYSSKDMPCCYFLEAPGWGQKLLVLSRETTTLVRQSREKEAEIQRGRRELPDRQRVPNSLCYNLPWNQPHLLICLYSLVK